MPVFIVSLLLMLCTARATTTIGRTAALTNGYIAALASSTAPSGSSGPLGTVDKDDVATAAPSGALWVNASDGSGWARRFGSGSDAPTTPEAVAIAADSVYVAASIGGRAALLKYDAKSGERRFRTYVGDEGDAVAQLAAEAHSGATECAKTALVAVAHLAARSGLLTAAQRGSARVAVLTLDACTGELVGSAIVLDARPSDGSVRRAESGMDIVLGRGGTIAYVGTHLVRVAGAVGNSNAVVYRVDLVSRFAQHVIMPRNDVLSMRLAIATDVIYIALDRHPIIIGDQDGDHDAVEIYRRHPDDLEPLLWGAKGTRTNVDLPFEAKLPTREASAFTKVVSIAVVRGAVALLLRTNETRDTWHRVVDTAPVPTMPFPSMRWLVWPLLSPPRWPLWSQIPLLTDTMTGVPEITPPSVLDTEHMFGSAPTLRQATATSDTVAARPMLLLVRSDATIARRIDDFKNSSISTNVLPLSASIDSRAQLDPQDMIVDTTLARAYIIGTVRTPGASSRLWYTMLNLFGVLSNIPSPSPSSKKQKVCLGLSSRTSDGRSLYEVARHDPRVRLQRHPRDWLRCARSLIRGRGCAHPEPVEMLCYTWSRWVRGDDAWRLCATEDHVVTFNGKLMYMKEFCSMPYSNRCTREKDVPWNFKGECGAHINVADDVAVTQHAGDIPALNAQRSAEIECSRRKRARVAWTLASL